MAHNLNLENGKASMFYIGNKPWHGLGNKLDKPATSKDALQSANLDWRVKKVPLFAIEGNKRFVSDKFGIVREDKWGKKDCKILGVVSSAYTPVQNTDAFEFFDRIVGKGAAIYHTAGVLGEGERIWIMAKLPDDIKVVEGDIVNKFLLLANGHDGNLSVQIKFTPVRVVCQNTLNIALNSNEVGLKIPHSRNVHQNLQNAGEALGIIQMKFNDIEEIFIKMAQKQLSSAGLSSYIEHIFPAPKKIKNKADERKSRLASEMRFESAKLFETGKGNEINKVKGTLWAAYNGVTEFVDFYKKLTNGHERLNYIWFGKGYSIKVKALEEANKILKA